MKEDQQKHAKCKRNCILFTIIFTIVFYDVDYFNIGLGYFNASLIGG